MPAPQSVHAGAAPAPLLVAVEHAVAVAVERHALPGPAEPFALLYSPASMTPADASSLHVAVRWAMDNLYLLVAVAFVAPFVLSLTLERLLRRAPSEEIEAAGVAAPEIPAAAEREALREEAPREEGVEEALPGEEVAPAPVVETEPAAPAAEVPPAVAPAPEPAPAPVEAPRVPLRERLARTSDSLVGRLGGLLGGRKLDGELLEDLEALLFSADLGVATAESLLEQVRERATGGDADAVRRVLREAILEKLERVQPDHAPLATVARPHVILVLGVNGSGKTTSIGKLAARYAKAGKRVVLGAGDTFRAAAIEQLQVWGERVGCEVIAGQAGGDPAAVAFDTVKAAVARQADVAIVDTAGRLQTKKPLMEELAKINRILSRDLPDAPHETLLVLDANTGQNAISQARLFTEVTQVSGLVLTKLDGSAKGGVIVGLADEFGIPVSYVGVGEGIDDLRDFDAREFVDALFPED